MIEASNISKWYRTVWGTKMVLDGVNFRLEQKDSLAIFGLNGAGKSTLLRVLGGAEMPDVGMVERRGKVSWPLGFAGGFSPALTGEENCRFVARIYSQDVDEVVAFASEFAEIGEYFHMPVRTYSSGMRARLAFGVSMALDFDTYLVDEVIAVGDKNFRAKCREAFQERNQRATMVMVSHQVDTLKKYCNLGAVLADGKLSMYGTVEEAQDAYEDIDRRAAEKS